MSPDMQTDNKYLRRFVAYRIKREHSLSEANMFIYTVRMQYIGGCKGKKPQRERKKRLATVGFEPTPLSAGERVDEVKILAEAEL